MTWLKTTEYGSLAASVFGTVIAAATQQTIYAAAPITLALSVNLLNRQKGVHELNKTTRETIAQVEQQLFAKIESNVSAHHDERENLLALQNQFEGFKRQWQSELEIRGKQSENIEEIKQAWIGLQQNLAELHQHFQERQELKTIKQIEAKIELITQQSQNHQIVIEKFQLQAQQLAEQLQIFSEQLSQEQRETIVHSEALKTVDNILTKMSTTLVSFQEELNNRPKLEEIQQNQDTLVNLQKNLEQWYQTFNNRAELKEIVQLKEQIAQLVSYQDLEQINQTVEQQFIYISQLLQESLPSCQYELIFERSGSRQLLMQALHNTQECLIMVCPWLTFYGADPEVVRLCNSLLEQGKTLKIGWGHLKDLNSGSLGKGSLYGTLSTFQQLQQKYPTRCQLKLLGTHEKYLVCDETFAMLGSHNFLTSDSRSREREVGLKTNDSRIVQGLIARFEDAPDLGRALAA